ncbi:hypothetical protein AMTRI_Chr05g70660 [Amborella trichopoda]
MLSSVIPIFAFLISGVLAPISLGLENVSCYESIFFFFYVETVFPYPWTMKALIFVLIPIVGSVYAW